MFTLCMCKQTSISFYDKIIAVNSAYKTERGFTLIRYKLYLNRCDSALKISEKLHYMCYFECFAILLAEICWQ